MKCQWVQVPSHGGDKLFRCTACGCVRSERVDQECTKSDQMSEKELVSLSLRKSGNGFTLLVTVPGHEPIISPAWGVDFMMDDGARFKFKSSQKKLTEG